MEARDPFGMARCFRMEFIDRPRKVLTNVVPIQISAAEKASQRDLVVKRYGAHMIVGRRG